MKSNKKGYLVPECEEIMLTQEVSILSGPTPSASKTEEYNEDII